MALGPQVVYNSMKKTVDPDFPEAHTILMVFDLDEKSASSVEADFQEVNKIDCDIQIEKRFVPAYVGDFAGFCVSVLSSVTGAAVYAATASLVKKLRKRKKGLIWIPFRLAESIAKQDLIDELGIKEPERIRAIDLESKRRPSKDITSKFHPPEKGYVFLFRDPSGRKHYYELSTDGEIVSYKRYAKNQKSLLELMES